MHTKNAYFEKATAAGNRVQPVVVGTAEPSAAVKRRRPFRRKEASFYLDEMHGTRLSPQTLAKLAVVGGGPPFRKAGRWPIYDPDDLDAWAEGRLSKLVRSTSELEKTTPAEAA